MSDQLDRLFAEIDELLDNQEDNSETPEHGIRSAPTNIGAGWGLRMDSLIKGNPDSEVFQDFATAEDYPIEEIVEWVFKVYFIDQDNVYTRWVNAPEPDDAITGHFWPESIEDFITVRI